MYMDLATGSDAAKPLGTLVIEVFDDLAPSAAREFILRVTGGGAGRAGVVAYERTFIHKIVDGVRLEGGRTAMPVAGGQSAVAPGKGGGGGVPIEECRRLRHATVGVVSLSAQTSDFSITAGPAHHLDGQQQVVGRVVNLRGLKLVVQLSEAEVDDLDYTPVECVMVTGCGVTSAGGTGGPGGALAAAAELRAARAAVEAERAARERGETKAETRVRLERESAELGASLKRSLADGMRNAGASRDRGGTDSLKKAKITEGGGTGAGARKLGMMDAMLGDISDDSDGSDDE